MDEELLELLDECYLALEDFSRTLDEELMEECLTKLKEMHTSLLTESEEDALLSAVYALEKALEEC